MKKLIAFLGFFLLTSLTLLYFYTPHFIVETRNPLIELVRKKNIPNHIELNPIQSKVSITHDGLSMQGILTKSNQDSTRATLLLIHGIRGNKGWWHTKSLVLADSGYQSLAIDLRAHGQSEGKYTTFGVKENEDIKAWITWLENNTEERPIGIWGQSLGGAVALQSLAEDDRIEFGIVESTFSNFSKITADYGSQFVGPLAKLFTKHFTDKAAKIADFDSTQANPIDACKRIQQPILFIHGDKDNKIKIDYNKENFDAIPHQNKAFYIVEGAGHYNVWNVGGAEYRDAVFEFVSDIK